jgi:hypothetical protein
VAKVQIILPPVGTKITREALEMEHLVTDIVNADISATAAIAESKLSLAFPTHAEVHNHDASYSAVGHDHAEVYEPAGVTWAEVSGKPATFPPDLHAASHGAGQPDAVSPASIGAATSGHNHDGSYEAIGAVATHAGAADPHTGYQKESEKGAANGYASLGAGGLVPMAQLATGVADGTKFVRDDGTLQAPVGGGPHAASHQNGGGDEVSVAGLSGLLADAQTPAVHAASHKTGGGDAIKLDELAAPTDVTDLNATAAAHGLLRKLTNVSTEFLNGAGAFSTPAGTGVPILKMYFAMPVLAALAWTNMPAALSFWLQTASVDNYAQQIDLTGYTQCRLTVRKKGVAGAAASKLILKYKAGGWTQTVADYGDAGVSEVSVAVNVQNTYLQSAWINLVAGAKANVVVALTGSGGDGALDPVFGVVFAEFK